MILGRYQVSTKTIFHPIYLGALETTSAPSMYLHNIPCSRVVTVSLETAVFLSQKYFIWADVAKRHHPVASRIKPHLLLGS